MGIERGSELIRVESTEQLGSAPFALTGVTQHVLYTSALERNTLSANSSAESGPCAVLIPIKKSNAWWALAQDERLERFHGAARARGHLAIGAEYASQIFRRLYHARYLPGSEWDFLTYFEFPVGEVRAFRSLLAALRDTTQNPEWEFVEREAEVWMTVVTKG